MPNQTSPASQRSRTRPRQPSMFQTTMVLPMVDPNTPPYRYPGSGPGESELWRIRANSETGVFSWPLPAPPPSNTRYHVRDHRTGGSREVLPPISELLRPPPGLHLQQQSSLASLSIPPPPGLIRPNTTRLTPPPPITATQSQQPVCEPCEQARLFHICTILESEKNTGTKSKPKMVQLKQRCLHPKQFDVLAPSFTRRDLIQAAYEAIGVEDRYVIGNEAGPPVTAHWTGARGGVNTAVSITNDQQWTGFKNSLRDTSKTVIEIKVIFKSNELTPWKRSTTMTGISTGDDETEELGEGTGVPFVEQFGSEKRAIGATVTKLRDKWACKKELPGHTSCVDARGEHIQLTVPRLEDWAKQINMSDGQPDAPPPDEVLDQWNIGRGNPPLRPRGRCGPRIQTPQPYPGPSTDSAHLSLATAGLLTAITGSITRRRSPSPPQPRKRARTEFSPSSSPAPPPHAELRAFLEECFRKIRMADDLERVYNILDHEKYAPEAFGDDRLDVKEIADLTGLPRGAILSMRAIARIWCENNAKKRGARK